MNINEVPGYSGNHVKAEDLGGRECQLTITSYEIRDVGGKGLSSDTKAVLTFQGATKTFVVNSTNAKAIAVMHGPEMNDWIGKEITLFATQTDLRGKIVPCIRVKLDHKTPAPVTFPPSGPQPLPGEPQVDVNQEQGIPF